MIKEAATMFDDKSQELTPLSFLFVSKAFHFISKKKTRFKSFIWFTFHSRSAKARHTNCNITYLAGIFHTSVQTCKFCVMVGRIDRRT